MNTQQLQARLNDVERRLEKIETRLKTLDQHMADLEPLKKTVGDLKYEMEQMQEA